MIEESYENLISSLNKLNEIYDQPDVDEYAQAMISRVALLELTSWIQQTQKQITLNYLRHKWETEFEIDMKSIEEYYQKSGVYGFVFEEQFLKPFRKFCGEVFIHKIKNSDKDQIKNYIKLLKDLNQKRKQAAHEITDENHLRTYDAPSEIRSKANTQFTLIKQITQIINKSHDELFAK